MNPHIHRGIVLFFLLGAGMAYAIQFAPDPLAGPPLQLKSPQEAIEILQNSTNRIEIAKAGIWLCKNNAQGAADQLLPFLLDPKFPKRLNRYSREGILGGPNLVSRILVEVGKLATPEAEEALLRLINDKEFASNFDNIAGLVDACGWLGTSSDKILPFLESQVGGLTGTVTMALARIGTPESCAVLKKQIFSKNFDIPNKKWWFEGEIMPVRNKPAVIMLYKDVLYSNIQDASLRNTVVQTLFDYRPEEWYGALWDQGGPEFVPHPPKWSETSPEVLKQVLEIADMALKMDITSETREGVLKAQKEIQQILLEKQKK